MVVMADVGVFRQQSARWRHSAQEGYSSKPIQRGWLALADAIRAGAEEELREAILTGRPVIWRTGDADADDPTNGAAWDAQRTVAAEFLAELLTATDGSRRPRGLRLTGARIVGRLDLEATELVCSLQLRECWFAQPAILDEAQAPALRLPGCHLPGLSAKQLTTRGDLSLDEGFTVHGNIRLDGAHIGGTLDLSRATLANPDEIALSAEDLIVDHSMVCSNGFTADGEVDLSGAHIGGLLVMDAASLANPDETALSAARLTVDGDMTCVGLTADGEVDLSGTHIGGLLLLSGATLNNPSQIALSAGRLTVDGDMVCRSAVIVNQETGLPSRRAFSAAGHVRLGGGHIGGTLDFSGATLAKLRRAPLIAELLSFEPDLFFAEFIDQTEPALFADGLTVDGDMICADGFSALGEVRLAGAHIGGTLDFSEATLRSPDRLTLNVPALRADGLFLRDLTEPPERADLTHAQVVKLADEPKSWPRRVSLDGFVYDVLFERSPIRARERLGWLARATRDYAPQPYEQLAAVYHRAGREQDALTVAIAKQRARRRTLGPTGRVWGWLLDVLVGYGYRTWLAGVWLIGFWLVGWAVFNRAYDRHDLVVANPGDARPSFHAAVYALDTLLPVVDLRQQAVWIPHGVAQWWAWTSILAGWVLTTAVVAALTGFLKRD
jgi:hypothetical protein